MSSTLSYPDINLSLYAKILQDPMIAKVFQNLESSNFWIQVTMITKTYLEGSNRAFQGYHCYLQV